MQYIYIKLYIIYNIYIYIYYIYIYVYIYITKKENTITRPGVDGFDAMNE